MNPQAIADSPAAAARPISRPLLLLTNSIPSRVLGKGHFRRAKVGHFWRAARLNVTVVMFSEAFVAFSVRQEPEIV